MSKKLPHYPTSANRLFLGAIVMLLGCLTGCPATSWEAVKDSKSVDELRKFIRQNPQDPMIDEARILITQIEFRNAQKANTRYAYQVFIERHSESSQALDARRKLEEMDFQKATKNPTPESLGSFLKLHPTGRNADKARRLREKLLCDKLLSIDNPDLIKKEISHHSGLECSQRIQEHIKSLELKIALDSRDILKLQTVVDRYPDDPPTKSAKQVLLDLQVKALLEAGLFDRAKKLIIEQSSSDMIQKLLNKIQRARHLWQIASFDLKNINPASKIAAYFRRNKKIVKKLRDATNRLRRSFKYNYGEISLKGTDPRTRWIEAQRLAFVVDEKASERLFKLLGDSFLEVRRMAYNVLPYQVSSLGPTRSRIWLARKLGQLRDKARFGPLLFKYAMVLKMLGDVKGAYSQIQSLNEAREEPDVLALAESVKLAATLGLGTDAARNGRDFSIVADKFSEQRILQWSKGAMVGKSSRGWLTLRQLYGLMNIWTEALRPFEAKSGKPPRFSSHESLFGPWLKKSIISRDRLATWLHDEENRWSQGHPDYVASASQEPGLSGQTKADVSDLLDLQTLAFMAGSMARPTIVWASCCHGNKGVRLAARVFRLQENLRISFQLAIITPMIIF